jgi:hypothetical protein
MLLAMSPDCADCGLVPLAIRVVLDDQAQTADAHIVRPGARRGVDDRLGLSTGLIGVAVMGPRIRLVPCRQGLRKGFSAAGHGAMQAACRLSSRVRVSGPCQMRWRRNPKGAAFLILDVDPGGR